MEGAQDESRFLVCPVGWIVVPFTEMRNLHLIEGGTKCYRYTFTRMATVKTQIIISVGEDMEK